MIIDTALRNGAPVGVYGCGMIGYSTMAHFANAGVPARGYDIDGDLVAAINMGDTPSPVLRDWLWFDHEPLVEEGLITASTDVDALADCRAHFIAVPTERDGEPWLGALEDAIGVVAGNVGGERSELVVIESTLVPGATEHRVLPLLRERGLTPGEDVYVAVAPRRDWFTSPQLHVGDIPRVFGAVTDVGAAEARGVLDIVCDNLVEARDHAHAELTKTVENAYRHVGIVLADQLSEAYPGLDVREVLELAATKWNMNAYHPGLGSGGYCVPLAGEYIKAGAAHPANLDVFQRAMSSDHGRPYRVAAEIDRRDVGSVAILGLAYAADIPVDVRSPTVPVAEWLLDHDIDVGVHDPYFGAAYIRERTGATPIEFPDGLAGHEAVLVAAGHRVYRRVAAEALRDALADCAFVVDHGGVWTGLDLPVEYVRPGASGWTI